MPPSKAHAAVSAREQAATAKDEATDNNGGTGETIGHGGRDGRERVRATSYAVGTAHGNAAGTQSHGDKGGTGRQASEARTPTRRHTQALQADAHKDATATERDTAVRGAEGGRSAVDEARETDKNTATHTEGATSEPSRAYRTASASPSQPYGNGAGNAPFSRQVPTTRHTAAKAYATSSASAATHTTATDDAAPTGDTTSASDSRRDKRRAAESKATCKTVTKRRTANNL